MFLLALQEAGRAEKSLAKYDAVAGIEEVSTCQRSWSSSSSTSDWNYRFSWDPSSLPSWIAEEELQFNAKKFQETGFTGALNYYAAMDM